MYSLLLFILLLPNVATATTYWVTNAGGAASCAAASGDTDPGQYRTKGQGIACLAAGDTLMVKAGETITTTNGDVFNEFGSVPSGISAAQPTRILCETHRTCTIRPSTIPNVGAAIGLRPRNHVVIGGVANGFITDSINANISATIGSHGIRVYDQSGQGDTTGIKIIGNLVRNYNAFGISTNSVKPAANRDQEVAYNTVEKRITPYFTGAASHPIYMTGINIHVHHNETHAVGTTTVGQNSYGLHCWHTCRNTLWEYNTVYVEGPQGRGIIAGGTEGAENNHVYRYNTFKRVGSESIDMCLDTNNSGDNVTAYHNTCDGFQYLYRNTSTSTGNTWRNNVCTTTVSCSTFIAGGSPTTSNNVTNASTSNFRDAANGDYSLVSTASTLIGQAFDVGLGSDIGAFQTIPQPTATITANVLTLTFAARFTPIQNLSTGGVSVACTPNPDACQTPTVASVVRRNGTDTIVDITISGLTSNACTSGQTWTVTYASGSGTWSNAINIGNTWNQPVFSFSSLSASNACTGSGPPADPEGIYISYDFDEGSGTTLTNTGSFGASGNGTLNGGSWANGGGVTLAQQSSTDYVAIPYGSGVNPTTQNLTIAFTVDVVPGNEALALSYFGSQLGTNQRFHVVSGGGTWRIGVGTYAATDPSEFSVSAGPVHICITANATSDVVTLHVNGVASMQAGGTQSISSYTLASNFELGRIANLTTGGGGTYRHFRIYTSVEDCNTIYTATLGGGGGTPTGTFRQVAVRAQDVFLDAESNAVNQRAINTATKVAINGAVAFVFQINCDDCGDTAFRLAYRKNGAGSWLQVPDTETSDGIYMWGTSAPAYFNTGAPGAEISGTCTDQTGATITTSAQTPTISFPASGCVVLRYVIRIGTNAVAGEYSEFRLETQSGGALDTYDNLARVDVIGRQMTH